MLKSEWSNALKTMKIFFICEGGYYKTYLYHMRFLCHLEGFSKMSISYFLHQNLVKLCTKAKTRPEIQSHDICHHDHIQILYTHDLNKQMEKLRQ